MRLQQVTFISSPVELLCLVGLGGVLLIIDVFVGPKSYDFLNFYSPMALTTILGYGAWRTATMHPVGIWTSMFWLRVATAIYFGFGNAVPFIANDVTMAVINDFHYATPEQMLKVNLISTFGALAIIMSSGLVDRSLRPVRKVSFRPQASRQLLIWGLLFGGLGSVIKYLVSVPYSFGLMSWQVPGILLQLSLLSSVGIYLLGSWAFARSRLMFIVVAAWASFDVLVGLATFSKTDVLFSLLMLGLATVHRGVSFWRAGSLFGLLTLSFLVAAPIVDFGRAALLEKYNSITGAGFEERLTIVERYFAGGREHFYADQFRSEFQGGLARLSYMNQSAFAVHLYDSKIHGDSLEAIAIVLIPRFIWPEKPNLNYLTEGFTLQATGRFNLTWPGRYAEVYWNWGWWGILLLLPPLGVVYALLSRYALWVFTAQRWAYFPVVLLAMRYGIDIAGPYATSGVGGLMYIILLHFALRATEVIVHGCVAPEPPIQTNLDRREWRA